MASHGSSHTAETGVSMLQVSGCPEREKFPPTWLSSHTEPTESKIRHRSPTHKVHKQSLVMFRLSRVDLFWTTMALCKLTQAGCNVNATSGIFSGGDLDASNPWRPSSSGSRSSPEKISGDSTGWSCPWTNVPYKFLLLEMSSVYW